MKKLFIKRDQKLLVKKSFVVFIILLLMFSIIISNKSSVLSNTVIKQWTYSDSSCNLSYVVTEYYNGSFVIKEYYFGSISKTITGSVYCDIINNNKWARPAVDSNTQSYWDHVRNNHEWNNLIEDCIALITYLQLGPVQTIINYLRNPGSGFAVDTVFSYVNSHSGLATDVTKVMYEMGLASDAAWDIMNTPGVIIPTFECPTQ